MILNLTKNRFLHTLIILGITSIALLSCNQNHSVEYYMEHVDEMHAKVKECKINKANADKDCQNAFEAMHRTSLKIDNMPKIK